MKSLDELLIGKSYPIYNTFKELLSNYESVTSNIKKYNEMKIELEKNTVVEGGLTLSEAHDIYWTLGLVNAKLNVNVDVIDLRNKLVNSIPNMSKYMDILRIIKDSEKNKLDILEKNIDFTKFGKGDCDEHHFIKINNHLVCAKCMASTKDYNASQSEIDFLTLCANERGLLLTNVEERDLPLYKVLLQEQYSILDKMDKTDPDYSENKYFIEENMLNEIYQKIRIAKLMDKKEYNISEYHTINPEYLSYEQGQKILCEIEEKRQEIIKSNSRHKDLLLEMCNVAMNEVLILRGHTIGQLLITETSEDELIALAKAYYNISNCNYRINSEYFSNEKDAMNYSCLTASPKINQKILDIKLKR